MTRPGPSGQRTTVITIVHGRHRHLLRQFASLDLLDPREAVRHVVVAMGDSTVAALVEQRAPATGVSVRERIVAAVPVGPDGELPLAAARNLGADIALERGADLLVFLDVDCLAHRDLITDYRAALTATAAPAPAPAPFDGRASAAGRDPVALAGPVLWCGQVSYLPPLPAGIEEYPLTGLQTWAAPHPARPVLPPGATRLSREVKLFWSLNFAVTADDWRTAGGFDPDYRGYGGEDTDFAMRVAALDGGLGWIGGAGAFHQHHPTSSPPWQHLTAIVRNAHVFRQRWGRFPMEGWLQDFAAAGAIEYRPQEGVLVVIADPSALPGH